MTKYALLIGVSEYESSKINPLPGVRKDIEAMQRILKQPDIGGFDDVVLLTNPNTALKGRRNWLKHRFYKPHSTYTFLIILPFTRI